MVDQLFFLFNDLLLWTTPAFDITGSVELSKLTCLPNQIVHVRHTISLGVKGQPYSADMVFLCKDQEEHDQWIRYLEAAIRTANELQANPGVRMIQGAHGRGASISLSPSPAPAHPPLSASPPAAAASSTSAQSHQSNASHPLSGASSAANYDAQHAHPQFPHHHHGNSHELEL
jgi:hypothetical protein